MRKLILLILLSLLPIISFSQKSINWYRVTTDTSTLNYNPFATGNTIKVGYYNINPKTGEQYRYTGSGTLWVKDSLFKGASTNITNVTNVTNTVTSIGGIRWVLTWSEFVNALNDPGVRSINICANLTATSKARVPTDQSTIKEIEGHGFEITVPSNIDTLLLRTYPSLTAANQGIDQQLRFTNVVFKGNNNVCMYISSNYGMKFEGCRFYSFNTALDLRWCMGAIIDQCYFYENNLSINLDYDTFTGGSNTDSQSNVPIISNCKFRTSSNHFAGIRIFACSGAWIFHNIFEGGPFSSSYDIYFDDNGATVVKELHIIGNYFEHSPGIAAVYCKMWSGICIFADPYVQLPAVSTGFTLVKFQSGGYGKMCINNIPFIPTGVKFQSVGIEARWWWSNIPAEFDPYAAANWVGMVAPINQRIDGWDPNGQTPYLQLGTRRP